MTFHLLSWAEREARETELARAAYRARPSNPKIAKVYEKYGLAPSASVQAGGQPSAAGTTRVTSLSFESTVRPKLKSVDMGVWRERMTQVEAQVCRIEFNDSPKGTGFLVGPDLLLTNYHVMERPLKGLLPVEQVACRFDYKVLSDGSRSEGAVVRLDKANWQVDSSRYSQAEAELGPRPRTSHGRGTGFCAGSARAADRQRAVRQQRGRWCAEAGLDRDSIGATAARSGHDADDCAASGRQSDEIRIRYQRCYRHGE